MPSLTEVRTRAGGKPAALPEEVVTFRRPGELPGVEVMDVKDSDRLWAVYHETYTICTIFVGESRWTYRAQAYESGPGRLMVMEPGEVHVTKAISGRGTFTVLVIDPEVIIPLAAEMGIAGTPHLDPGRARAPELWRRFAGLDQALHNGDSSALCRQTLLSNALLALLSRSSERPPDNRPCDGWRAVNRAREHIHDSTGRDITLCELAGVAGISPYYLTREFTRLVGIPQHRYQMLVRTERARSLLVMGIPAVEVATLAGFADQSHMIRCFKRVWAVTPSAYMGRTCPAETARTSNRRRLPGSYDPLRRSRFGG